MTDSASVERLLGKADVQRPQVVEYCVVCGDKASGKQIYSCNRCVTSKDGVTMCLCIMRIAIETWSKEDEFTVQKCVSYHHLWLVYLWFEHNCEQIS